MSQLNTDMVTLKAANQRVKMTMGADRFRAAQAALAAEQGSDTAPPPRGDDGADILALARAAGIGRFVTHSGGPRT